LHALSSVSGMPQVLTDHAPQTIDYNDYNKVSRINQGTMTHSITHGVARQWVKSTFANMKRAMRTCSHTEE